MGSQSWRILKNSRGASSSSQAVVSEEWVVRHERELQRERELREEESKIEKKLEVMKSQMNALFATWRPLTQPQMHGFQFYPTVFRNAN
ncbi:unnamed protein product [Cuscuta europaea]|uniref:Uncharacterized protein n=1 Tax=Cuscuta europaea TaxID=41803 RepID=A0A9P0YXF9_CUSEU|nr:unnamed protein product [Cuscuta europaea]